MKIVVTAGGNMGHINPALAIIDEFKKQYATLKSKEKEIECKIEKLEKENKDKISVERLVSILKEFKTAENFDNNIMKQLINRIEIGEDKTVSIIFNF